MSANLSSSPKLQFFDNDGNPLVGGKLYTYAAGTSTPLATYIDSSASTPNTNPIILDSRGEANVWLTSVSYKFVLKTAADATIWTVDNVSNAINTSQILATSGSAAAPPYTFSADTTTGMYLAAVGQVGIAAGGVPVLRSNSTAMTIGQIGGANDVDVTLYGDFAQTGNITQTGNFTLTGDMTVNGAAVFNEAGADKDFRVEGDTDPNLLFVDASADFVGVGTNTPSVKMHVQQTSATIDAVTNVLRIDSQSSGVPSNGIGVGMEFAAETAAGNTEVGVIIEAIANDTTPAGEDFSLVFKVMQNGAAPTQVMQLLYNGDVGVGPQTPQVRLHAQKTTATTNAVTQILRIDSQSSGTPANGIGVGMQFATETAAGNTEIGATIEAITTDVTGGSEDFDLSFKVMAAGAAAAQQARLTSTGLWQMNSGYGSVATAYGCRAWINFDGTGTPTARASGNVSSITDNGAGDYTINFTNAMPDANYAVSVSAPAESNGVSRCLATLYTGGNPFATGSVRVNLYPTGGGGGGLFDTSYYTVAIFR